MEPDDAATSAAAEENTAVAAPAPAPIPAAAAAAAETADIQRRRRPRVAFHVTGFGVFNGVPDNPTTHLITELPGQLRDRPRRPLRYDDYHGHDRRGGEGLGEKRASAAEARGVPPPPPPPQPQPQPLLPAFGGGDGEGAFEVRSCQVLHVSAEVGGRQVRELHAASLGSSARSERPLAAQRPSAAATAASAAGSGVQGKSADEGGGPGGGGCGGGDGSGGDGPASGSEAGDRDGSDDSNHGVVDGSGDGDDDDAVTVFVHCGVKGGTDRFELETRGFNEADFRVPDERGFTPSLAPIDPGLPKEHCRVTTVPVPDVLERLGELGWGPGHVAESRDAGRFVCNYVYYTSLGLCEASSPAEPAAADVAAEGGVQAEGASEEEQREVAKDVFCFSGAGAGGGGGGGGGGGREGDRPAPNDRRRRRRHSLFIHVPPFEAVPKEKQLALLMACLSTIAAAVSSPTPLAVDNGHDDGVLGDSPFVAPAATPAPAAAAAEGVEGATAAAATANGATPAPLLSLSTYEAAVLAAGAEALSPEPAEPAPAPIGDEQESRAERAAPAAVPSIWDGAESAEISPQPAAAEDEDEAAGRGGGDGGGGGGVGTQRVVQFALAGLAENQDSGYSGGIDGAEGDEIYYRGELGGGSGSEAGEDNDDDVDGNGIDDGGEAEEGGGETPADATRRRLIAAGFDPLDVDAAMATTGSDNTEVNMGFLLDITPLLPRGAPSDAGVLNLRECMNDGDQNGGGGNGDRGRGATVTGHARSGSGSSTTNGGGAIRPRVRPAASPAGMGGVSPKWIADVSPVRDGTPRSGGGGGLLSRLRRGHKRVPSTASAASEATDGEGERSSDHRALSSSSATAAATGPPRQRPSFTSLSSSPAKQQPPHDHQQGEYARRTTGHVARSHSPPPLRGFGRPAREFGSGGCAPRVASGWGELAPSGPNLRLCLVVRLDLEMAPGTAAAQCSRAALAATRKAESGGRADTLAVWREAGESIVVVGAADAGSLDAVLVIAEAAHLPVTMVRDKQAAWVGNVRAGTCTVAAIGPAPMSALRSVAGGLTVL